MRFDTVLQFTTQLATGLKQSVQLVPVVWRKPRIISHWMLNARKAQITLIVLAILVPFVLNPLVDMLLAALFGTVTEEHLFGLFKNETVNPNLEMAQLIAHWFVWITSLLICTYLFIRNLPDTLEQHDY